MIATVMLCFLTTTLLQQFTKATLTSILAKAILNYRGRRSWSAIIDEVSSNEMVWRGRLREEQDAWFQEQLVAVQPHMRFVSRVQNQIWWTETAAVLNKLPRQY